MRRTDPVWHGGVMEHHAEAPPVLLPESRWTDSGVFDIRRPHRSHISFGAGEHMCMGMHLARLETEVMFNSLFDRVTDLTVAPDGDADVVGVTLRSPNRLPVSFAAVA